jgi:hypothetical protein
VVNLAWLKWIVYWWFSWEVFVVELDLEFSVSELALDNPTRLSTLWTVYWTICYRKISLEWRYEQIRVQRERNWSLRKQMTTTTTTMMKIPLSSFGIATTSLAFSSLSFSVHAVTIATDHSPPPKLFSRFLSFSMQIHRRSVHLILNFIKVTDFPRPFWERSVPWGWIRTSCKTGKAIVNSKNDFFKNYFSRWYLVGTTPSLMPQENPSFGLLLSFLSIQRENETV